MRLILYSSELTPRVRYAWQVLLSTILRLEYECCSDVETYRLVTGCKINYSKQRQDKHEVFIPAGNLLFESDIRPQTIHLQQFSGLPTFYTQKATNADLPFDLPAMVFYLISRYEEYLPFLADEHGRFPAQQSLAQRANFLQQPLVNQWALKFYELLRSKYPELPILKPSFRFQPSYDVDIAWAYRNKGWWRSVAAGARDVFGGNFSAIRQRFEVTQGKSVDPFDVYHLLDDLHEQFDLQPIYFFLLGNYGKFDKSISFQNIDYQKLIHQLSQKCEVGIHPSYVSNQMPERVKMEKQRLEAIAGRPVVLSRQHYLMLRFPDTYRNLLDTGITDDFSMGYAGAIGFRASITTPYPWYDLLQEVETKLQIHPFQIMDVSLKEYLQYTPTEAIAQSQQIIAAVRAVGGTFSTIWHNSSFSNIGNWQGWKEVYETILRIATADE